MIRTPRDHWKAEEAGFEVMVTSDRNLRYQQNLEDRQIALVILPSGRWPLVEPQVNEVVEAVDHAEPGSYKEIPLRNQTPKRRPPGPR